MLHAPKGSDPYLRGPSDTVFRALPGVRRRGASVVGVSQLTPSDSLETVRLNELSFPSLADSPSRWPTLSGCAALEGVGRTAGCPNAAWRRPRCFQQRDQRDAHDAHPLHRRVARHGGARRHQWRLHPPRRPVGAVPVLDHLKTPVEPLAKSERDRCLDPRLRKACPCVPNRWDPLSTRARRWQP